MFCARCNRVYEDLTLRTCPTCHHRLAGPHLRGIDRSPQEALARWSERFPHLTNPTTIRPDGVVHRHTHERSARTVDRSLSETLHAHDGTTILTNDETTERCYTFAELIAEVRDTEHRWEMMALVGQVRLLGDPAQRHYLCIVESPTYLRFYEARHLILFLHDFKHRFPLISRQPWRLMPVEWSTPAHAKQEVLDRADARRLGVYS